VSSAVTLRRWLARNSFTGLGKLATETGRTRHSMTEVSCLHAINKHTKYRSSTSFLTGSEPACKEGLFERVIRNFPNKTLVTTNAFDLSTEMQYIQSSQIAYHASHSDGNKKPGRAVKVRSFLPTFIEKDVRRPYEWPSSILSSCSM
jgi:hypothetical protein